MSQCSSYMILKHSDTKSAHQFCICNVRNYRHLVLRWHYERNGNKICFTLYAFSVIYLKILRTSTFMLLFVSYLTYLTSVLISSLV